MYGSGPLNIEWPEIIEFPPYPYPWICFLITAGGGIVGWPNIIRFTITVLRTHCWLAMLLWRTIYFALRQEWLVIVLTLLDKSFIFNFAVKGIGGGCKSKIIDIFHFKECYSPMSLVFKMGALSPNSKRFSFYGRWRRTWIAKSYMNPYMSKKLDNFHLKWRKCKDFKHLKGWFFISGLEYRVVYKVYAVILKFLIFRPISGLRRSKFGVKPQI